MLNNPSCTVLTPVPATATDDDVRVELGSRADTYPFLHDWEALENRVPACPLMNGQLWTRTWLEHYGDLVPHRIAVGSVGGNVIGMALITEGVARKDGPISVRSIHVGTSGEPEADSVRVEYNGLCALPEYREQFARQLRAELDKLTDWDELCLDGFSPETARLLIREGDANVLVESRVCHFHDLANCRQRNIEPIDRFGKSTTKALRRNFNVYKDHQLEWTETVDSAHNVFDELIELHQSRWTAAGQPGAYASQRFTSFHRDLIDRLCPTGRMSFARLRHQGETIGCNQHFIDGQIVRNYQGGRMVPRSNLSPGLLIDYLSIEESLKRGFEAYDFMATATMHKQRLSSDSTELVWARIRRPRVKYAVVDVLRKVKRGLSAR